MKIELEEFNKIKEHFAKEKESEQNKIFEFLDYFKQRLIDDFKKNFKLILGLIIEKKERIILVHLSLSLLHILLIKF